MRPAPHRRGCLPSRFCDPNTGHCGRCCERDLLSDQQLGCKPLRSLLGAVVGAAVFSKVLTHHAHGPTTPCKSIWLTKEQQDRCLRAAPVVGPQDPRCSAEVCRGRYSRASQLQRHWSWPGHSLCWGLSCALQDVYQHPGPHPLNASSTPHCRAHLTQPQTLPNDPRRQTHLQLRKALAERGWLDTGWREGKSPAEDVGPVFQWVCGCGGE